METTKNAERAMGDERLVYSVAEAGALLGISRAFAYEFGRPRRAPGHSLGPTASRSQGCPQRPHPP
jgi:hypothetical protein